MSFLAGWDNFYVIVGSAAAGLTGLTFVVIALAADSNGVHTSGMSVFVTPAIVHFGTVLALAAFLNVPRQSVMSLSIGLGITGALGLIYAAAIIASMRRLGQRYVPVREDWLWHAIWPTLVYGVLFACSILMWRQPEATLYVVAAAITFLLFVGIHNAWDVAITISIRKQRESSGEKSVDTDVKRT